MQIWEKNLGFGDLSACGQSCAGLQWSYKNREDQWNNCIFCFKLYSPARESFRLKLSLCRLLDPCCFSWKLCARGGHKASTSVHTFTGENVIIWVPLHPQAGAELPASLCCTLQALLSSTGTFPNSSTVVWELWHRLNSGWVSLNQRLNEGSVFSKCTLSSVWAFPEHQAAKQTDGSRELHQEMHLAMLCLQHLGRGLLRHSWVIIFLLRNAFPEESSFRL